MSSKPPLSPTPRRRTRATATSTAARSAYAVTAATAFPYLPTNQATYLLTFHLEDLRLACSVLLSKIESSEVGGRMSDRTEHKNTK